MATFLLGREFKLQSTTLALLRYIHTSTGNCVFIISLLLNGCIGECKMEMEHHNKQDLLHKGPDYISKGSS